MNLKDKNWIHPIHIHSNPLLGLRLLNNSTELLKKEILEKGISTKYKDINEILELSVISRYFLDAKKTLPDCTEEENREFIEKSKEFKKIVAGFFSKITDKNISGIYEKSMFIYKYSFWINFEKNKLYEKITGETFEQMLPDDTNYAHYILNREKIVNKYENEIENYLIKHPKSAELFRYKHANKKITLYLNYFP